MFQILIYATAERNYAMPTQKMRTHWAIALVASLIRFISSTPWNSVSKDCV